MKKLINKYDKAAIYDLYQTVLEYEDIEDYDDITKYEMIIDIRNHFLNHKSDFYELFSLSKIDILLASSEKVFTDKDIMNLVSTIAFDDTLLYLIAFINVDGNYFVDKIIHDELLINIDRTKLKELEVFKNFVRGSLLTYGILLFKDIDNLYLKNRDENYHVYKEVKLEKLKKFLQQLHVEDYILFNDGIAHKYFNQNENYYTGIQVEYDINYYVELGEYGLFYDYYLLKKNKLIKSFKFYFSDYILTDLLQTKNNEDKINNLLELSRYEDDIILKTLLNWPLWHYGGKSISLILSNETKIKSNKDSLSAIDKELEEEFAIFFNAYLYHANMTLKISEYTNSIEEFVYRTSTENNQKLLKESIDNNKLINDFISSNVYKHFKHYDEFITALRNPITIEKGIFNGFDDEDRAQIMNDSRCYHVIGLSSDMKKVLGNSDLRLFDITLLLLNNYVCYYFFINEYNIELGPNLRSIIDESYTNSKHIYNINDIINIQ